MVNITEMVLFYSRYSPKCRDAINFINHYNFPVQQISIDSKETRDIIANGPYFKIKGVPSIIVTYADGNAELYEGEKVISWMSQLVATKEEPQRIPKHKNVEQYDDMDEEIEEFDDDEEEYEVLDAEESLYGKKNIKEKKMADIKDLAKKMEMERKKTLGYDESNLPY